MQPLSFGGIVLFLAAMLGTSVAGSANPLDSLRVPAALGDRQSSARSNEPIDGHLFVAGTVGSTPYVARFLISNGLPNATPDRTYQGVGWPIAVDRLGNLYATSGTNVSVFPRGSRKPVRTLSVGPATSLYVDREGYLYVGGWWGDEEGEYWYVQVYAPGASGNQRYVQYISIGSCLNQNQCGAAGFASGLGVDSQGNLHVSSSAGKMGVYTFASPTTNPTPMGFLSGSGIVNPWGLAINHDELYIDNPNGANSFASAYRVTSNGNSAPDRVVSVAGSGSFGPGIATDGRRLFVPDTAANVVYELRVAKNGPQSPLATLSISAPLDVKAGP